MISAARSFSRPSATFVNRYSWRWSEQEGERLGRKWVGVGAAAAVLVVLRARRPAVDAPNVASHPRLRQRVPVGEFGFHPQLRFDGPRKPVRRPVRLDRLDDRALDADHALRTPVVLDHALRDTRHQRLDAWRELDARRSLGRGRDPARTHYDPTHDRTADAAMWPHGIHTRPGAGPAGAVRWPISQFVAQRQSIRFRSCGQWIHVPFGRGGPVGRRLTEIDLRPDALEGLTPSSRSSMKCLAAAQPNQADSRCVRRALEAAAESRSEIFDK
jgi:hypothetical protein